MERGAKMLPPRPPPGLKLNITRVFFAVLIRRETKIEEALSERGEESLRGRNERGGERLMLFLFSLSASPPSVFRVWAF